MTIKIADTKDEFIKIKNYIREYVEWDIDPWNADFNAEKYIEKLISNAIIVIMLNGDIICGIACSYINDFQDKIAHLQLLHVLQQYRNNGLGRDLCEKVIFLSKNKGMEKVILTVRKDNIIALKLYKKLGFVESKVSHKNNKKKYMEYVFK